MQILCLCQANIGIPENDIPDAHFTKNTFLPVLFFIHCYRMPGYNIGGGVVVYSPAGPFPLRGKVVWRDTT